MSSEWQSFEIETLCTVCSSKRVFAADYVEKGIPFFASKDVIDKALGSFTEPSAYISEKRFDEIVSKTGYPSVGDVLLSSVGNRSGISYVVKDKTPFYFKDGNVLWFKNFNGLTGEFLNWWLRSNLGQDALNSIMIGSAQKALTISGVQKLKIKTPTLTEQNRIVAILNSLDDRIALLRETNATLEAIAQALFKSWFVDFDPVHANAGTQAPSLPAEIQALFPSRLVESPQGLIPEGWEWGAISDYAELNPESWTAKKHPETVAYIDLANAKDNVIADIAEFVFADAPSRARRVLKDRDTIVGTVRPGNRSFAFIFDAASNLTGSTGFAVLRPKHPSNTAFIYLAATNDSSIDHLTHVADGGAYPAVRPDVVAGLTCVRAPADVLEAFNEVSEELLCKISKNHSLAQTLSDLRDTLLPRLISGQLRLPEAEVALAEV